jgi:hypothetical protein
MSDFLQHTKERRRLLDLARSTGDRHYDVASRLCLIVRDTCWYATSLLFDPAPERRLQGNEILRSLRATDGTHTPASMIALLLGVPDLLEDATQESLRASVLGQLVDAAQTEWKDGNVNHPLAAYCTLILGGEMHAQQWALQIGLGRLRIFQERIGDHRAKTFRQAEMSEYNSLTYTALDLCFLALIAHYARTPEARALALFLEEALWVNVAMHYHAPSNQFAGPHSRSYHEDSVGGYSALHCALLAASGKEIFLDPSLSVRFDHPSNLLQNALTAITPFHMPERAVRMAWEKPMPFTFRMMTYGESYHENGRRGSSPGSPFAFDEDVYPGGWTDLTTYMTRDYALGSAALPYVNAGHADSVMLRICRSQPVRGIADYRSLFTRGVYNGALPGLSNFCHTALTQIDASYLYEEGRCATYQHENRLIIAYTPKRAGHQGVESFRTDLIFSYPAPFDAVAVDGKIVDSFPAETRSGGRICIRDGCVYLLLVVLEAFPCPAGVPVRLSVQGDFFLVSAYNYAGPRKDFSREEINLWRSGYYLEVWGEGDFKGWEEFVVHARAVSVEESLGSRATRSIRVRSGSSAMEFHFDPFREQIISRRWCGREDAIDHFTVSAGGATGGPYCPATLYGSEGKE